MGLISSAYALCGPERSFLLPKREATCQCVIRQELSDDRPNQRTSGSRYPSRHLARAHQLR